MDVRELIELLTWSSDHEVTHEEPGGMFALELALGAQRSGFVWYRDEDAPILAYGLRDGVLHGHHVRLHDGVVVHWTHYEHGLEHGRARQFHDGAEVGSYTMDRGDGVARWFTRDGLLCEERPQRAGRPHGPTRLWRTDLRVPLVWHELHYRDGVLHGPERRWSLDRPTTLDPGFPIFWVRGSRVGRDEYVIASTRDDSLPPYDAAEDAPVR